MVRIEVTDNPNEMVKRAVGLAFRLAKEAALGEIDHALETAGVCVAQLMILESLMASRASDHERSAEYEVAALSFPAMWKQQVRDRVLDFSLESK